MRRSGSSHVLTCFVIFVAMACFIEASSAWYPKSASRSRHPLVQESPWLNAKQKSAPSLVFVRTIEDLLNATVSQPQSACQVQGRIQGETSLVHSIGIYSNDYRVVLYQSEIAPDGTFSVSNILPGTYRAAPLPKEKGKLLFTPPMGRLISCHEEKTFTADFSVQGVKMWPNQKHLESSSRNSNREQHYLKKRKQGNPSQTGWSKYRRRELVLEVLKGHKSYEEAAQEHDLRIEEIQEWRDQFLLNAEEALQHEK